LVSLFPGTNLLIASGEGFSPGALEEMVLLLNESGLIGRGGGTLPPTDFLRVDVESNSAKSEFERERMRLGGCWICCGSSSKSISFPVLGPGTD
jgi:hypothetical protein